MHFFQDNTAIPNNLIAVEVPISDMSICVKNYSKLGNIVPQEGMICAGYSSGGKDACSVSEG